VPVSILGTSIAFDYYHHVLNEYYINGDESKFAVPSVYEDRNCSNSLGPLYSVPDHFTYFDVMHLQCLPDLIQEFTAIPNVIFPIEDIPEMPRFIQILLGDLGALLSKLLSPIFG